MFLPCPAAKQKFSKCREHSDFMVRSSLDITSLTVPKPPCGRKHNTWSISAWQLILTRVHACVLLSQLCENSECLWVGLVEGVNVLFPSVRNFYLSVYSSSWGQIVQIVITDKPHIFAQTYGMDTKSISLLGRTICQFTYLLPLGQHVIMPD